MELHEKELIKGLEPEVYYLTVSKEKLNAIILLNRHSIKNDS